MADYTEEQRVKQRYPDAYCAFPGKLPEYGCYRVYWGTYPWNSCVGQGDSEAAAWADASRRLGNEFVDEVGPLAERKEG